MPGDIFGTLDSAQLVELYVQHSFCQRTLLMSSILCKGSMRLAPVGTAFPRRASVQLGQLRNCFGPKRGDFL